MERIHDLEAFIATVEEGSLTRASRVLGRSLHSISRSLMTLERDIGVELIRRTTRQLHILEAGQLFYQRIKPAIAQINDARLEAANRHAEPSGVLRIGAPILFASRYLVPVVASFMERYPRIEVEMKLSDKFADLAEEGIDVAIRIGDMPDSGIKARRLGELRRVTFGSPLYFAKHGKPAHPDELARHQCVIRSLEGGAVKWPYRIDGKIRQMSVTGRFRSDNSAATYTAAAQGLGIGFTPLWQIRDLVDQGELEIILADFEAPRRPIRAVWTATKLLPARTRLFIDYLAANLQCERL
jgi:DNA-binding transcriptional LysR family regulator